MQTRFGLIGLVAAASLSVCGNAAAAVQVIHSTVVGHPTSVVPGYPALRFDRFDLPWRNPNGQHWMMLAGTNCCAISDDVLLRGSGLSSAVVLKEGDAAPWAPSETMNTIDWMLGLNDNGQWAISVNNNTVTEINDEYLLRWNGGSYDIIAFEGDPVPGIPGATYGVILDEAHILNDGRVGFHCININNVPADQNVVCFLGDQVIAREGVTVPTGQAAGGLNSWETFDFLTYRHSDSGAAYLISGRLNPAGDGSTDGVLVVNNSVVNQEGSLIAGFGQPVVSGLSGHAECFMMSNGDWFARGSNSGGQDWVLRNGIALARTGNPIFSGSTELWNDATPNVRTYNIHQGNNIGGYAIGGWTNNADLTRNYVVALTNDRVIVREGDMVDLNGNGQSDDDAFIVSLDDDEAFLTDEPAFHFVAKLRNGAGTAIGEAYLRLPLCQGQPGDVNADCSVNVDDLLGVINAWGACPGKCPPACAADIAPAGGNCTVNVDDLLAVINNWG